MMLSPDDQHIVLVAQQMGLLRNDRPPSYLGPNLCIYLSIALAPLTLGFSFLFVPILWVIQHDLTASQLVRLRSEIECQVRVPQKTSQSAPPRQDQSRSCNPYSVA
jgi:hypothetical protein